MTVSWFPASEEIKQLLRLAVDHWENPTVSNRYMHQALAIAKEDPDVWIAAYRYFFYQNNCEMALNVASAVIAYIRKVEQLPESWDVLKPILYQRKEDSIIRLYLNTRAASALLLAKIGAIEMAKEITTQILEIDDKNEFGAASILHILMNPGDDDEEST
jgi:hypothetical protein